jgi:hypothetical protein
MDENRLSAWVPVTRITNVAWQPLLNDRHVESILRQNPVKVEINTLQGTRYYNIIQDSVPGPVHLILVEHENQRFILPEKIFTQLIKDPGEAP